MHGMSAVLHHFKNKFPYLKYMTVCEWRKAITVSYSSERSQSGHRIRRKRRKASSVPENLISFIMKYICAIHNVGDIINTAIAIAAALGIIKKVNPMLLKCNGGHVVLQESYLLLKFCETEGYGKKAQGHSIKF